jgi:hypothetical protein
VRLGFNEISSVYDINSIDTDFVSSLAILAAQAINVLEQQSVSPWRDTILKSLGLVGSDFLDGAQYSPTGRLVLEIHGSLLTVLINC